MTSATADIAIATEVYSGATEAYPGATKAWYKNAQPLIICLYFLNAVHGFSGSLFGA